MEWLVIIAIIVIGAMMFSGRSSKKSTPQSPAKINVPLEVTVTMSSSSRGGFASEVKTGELTEVPGGFVLNPKAPLPLTIMGISRGDAAALKTDLDKSWVDYRLRQEVAFLVAKKNLRCAEIDQFVARQRRHVDAEVERLRSSSTEWGIASEKDRRDLLVGFQEAAIDALPEKPPHARNLRALLEGPPKDISADDALLNLFGSDVEGYKSYIYLLSAAKSVKTVPAEDYYRKRFEAFVEKGLARRGLDIPLADILGSLRLKELNELLTGSVEKPPGRKAKAIELALHLPGIKDRLSDVISFRELFQILPPPGLDVEDLRRSFAWASEVADLFCETYAAGIRTLQTVSEHREYSYEGYRIRAAECCSNCASFDGRTSKSKPSKVPPFHVGCVCELEGIFADV